MPFQLNHIETKNGTPHPESFWSITDLATRFVPASNDHGITVVKYTGWHNKATFDNSKEGYAEKTFYVPAGLVHFERTIGDAYDLLEIAIQSFPEPGGPFFALADYIARTNL